MPLDLDALPERTTALLADRAFAALTTIRPDGRPHTAVVGYSYDPATHECWLILRGSGVKYGNLTATGGAQPVTLCQLGDGGRWITFAGMLRLVPGPEALAATLRRYRDRYGEQIGDDPTRVCAVLTVTNAYGTG
jgi:F420H(2)-dependent biliverdin reductase